MVENKTAREYPPTPKQIKDLFQRMKETTFNEPKPLAGGDMDRLVRTYADKDKLYVTGLSMDIDSSEWIEIFTIFPNLTEFNDFISEIPEIFKPQSLDPSIYATIARKVGPGLEENYRTPTIEDLDKIEKTLSEHPNNLIKR